MPRTPREEAEDITAGRTPPHHIGTKSKEVLIQEIWSLDNTKEAFRKSGHDELRKSLVNDLQTRFGLTYSGSLWRQTHKP